MALPPEPLELVLPRAIWVLDAEVAEVIDQARAPAKKEAPAGATGIGVRTAKQTVRLTVKRVLKGERITELEVEKPESGYSLKVGHHGPFLIDETRSILGRYGPDSYAFSHLEAALKK